MDGHGVERVVHLEDVEDDEVAGEEAEAGEDADEDGGPRLVDVAACAEADHAGQGAVQGHEVAPLGLQHKLVEEEHGEAGAASAQDRVDDGTRHSLGIALVRDGGLEF